MDTADPMDRIDAADPTDPIDSTEPIEPTDSTDPLDPILSTDSSDQTDHRELRHVVVPLVAGPHLPARGFSTRGFLPIVHSPPKE